MIHSILTAALLFTAHAAPLCMRDADCSDSLFCTGVERCAPHDAAADKRGCVRGIPPCKGLPCDEVRKTCRALRDCTKPSGRDLDGDGFVAVECGGNDCDDYDRLNFPGNGERCDGLLSDGVTRASDHDEDCNSATVAALDSNDGDADGDGQKSILCSNKTTTGALITGTDCDDTVPSRIFSSQVCGAGTGTSSSVLICKLLRAAPGVIGSNPGGIGPVLGQYGWAPNSCSPGLVCHNQPNLLGVCGAPLR